MRYRQLMLALTVLTVVGLGGCAEVSQTTAPAGLPPTGPVAEAPTLREGDEWTWKTASGSPTMKVIGFEGDFIVTTSTSRSCNGCKQYRDQHFTVVKTTGQDARGEKFLDFPLFVGKQWKYPSQFTTPEGRTISFEITCKVQGVEQVTVPAGTFQGFKIQRDLLSETGWRGRTAHWYAPEAKRIVKVSDLSHNFPPSVDWNIELVSYSLKK